MPNPTHDARSRIQTSRLIECSQCGALRKGGEPCAACGFFPKRRPDAIIFREGELARVDRNGPVQSSDPNERMRWYAELSYIAQERGYKPGWVFHKYKEKFSTWPPSRFVTPRLASPEVLSWVRSRNIAWANAQLKSGAA